MTSHTAHLDPPSRTTSASVTTASVTTAPHRRSCPVLRRLDHEWRRIERRTSSLERVRSWTTRLDDPVQAAALTAACVSAGRLDDVVAATHRRSHLPGGGTGTGAVGSGGSADVRDAPAPVPDPDEILGALIVAAEHDSLAARIVLQRILPGVIAQADRWAARQREATALDQALGACWIAIRAYDVGRRRRHVAAALVSDVIWIAFRRSARRRYNDEIPTPNSVLSRRPAPLEDLHPVVALAGTVRAAESGGTARRHLDLIRDLARLETPTAMAQHHAVTTRTIRNRRDAAVAEIRRSLGPDWTDWTDRLTAAA